MMGISGVWKLLNLANGKTIECVESCGGPLDFELILKFTDGTKLNIICETSQSSWDTFELEKRAHFDYGDGTYEEQKA